MYLIACFVTLLVFALTFDTSNCMLCHWCAPRPGLQCNDTETCMGNTCFKTFGRRKSDGTEQIEKGCLEAKLKAVRCGESRDDDIEGTTCYCANWFFCNSAQSWSISSTVQLLYLIPIICISRLLWWYCKQMQQPIGNVSICCIA